MNASTCIYMYCYIEKNIMKNQFGSPDFRIQGKISMYICFMFSPLYIFYFNNSFAGDFYLGLTPTVS